MGRVLSSAEGVSGEPTGWHIPRCSLGNIPPNQWLEVPSLWGIAIQRKNKWEKEIAEACPFRVTHRLVRNKSQAGRGS